jgi:hypothetical protein
MFLNELVLYHFSDVLHHFSFETPTSEGVLSDNGDTFSALEMRKCVKTI